MSTKRKPGWALRIEELLNKMHLTQAGLAERLDVSPMTVSRWVRGTNRPTAETYIKFAALSGPPEESYFLDQAGLNSAGISGTFSSTASSVAVKLTAFRLLAGRQITPEDLTSHGDGIAIPILVAYAHADGEKPDRAANLSRAPVDHILTVPLEWARNTTSLIGVTVEGDSMSPLISNGSILIVDTSVTQHDKLYRKIVIASHRDFGLRVAWLQQAGNVEILAPENQHYPLKEINGKTHWVIVGEVLWWVSRPPAR
jgi:transcriptional regulator with XRE-family HTH domain